MSVIAYSGGDSPLETRPHVESEGVLLTCVTDNMDKLEPTKVFRLLRKEQSDEVLTQYTVLLFIWPAPFSNTLAILTLSDMFLI